MAGPQLELFRYAGCLYLLIVVGVGGSEEAPYDNDKFVDDGVVEGGLLKAECTVLSRVLSIGCHNKT